MSSLRTFSTMVEQGRVYVEHRGLEIVTLTINDEQQLESYFNPDDLIYIKQRVKERADKEQQQKAK